MYAPYFSRSAIVELQSVIKENTAIFLHRLEIMAASSDDTIDLSRGFKCLTAGAVLQYIFNRSLNALVSPDFKHPLVDPVEDSMSDWSFTAAWYFPRLMGGVASFCRKWPSIGKLNKSFRCAIEQVEVSYHQNQSCPPRSFASQYVPYPIILTDGPVLQTVRHRLSEPGKSTRPLYLQCGLEPELSKRPSSTR